MAIFNKIEARKSAFSKARKNECSFVDALKTEDGAIDLASIMVGVIVIGVIAGVIAATVFAVIPWAQDKAAGSSLDAVNAAESTSFAQSTDKGLGVYQGTTGVGVTNITTNDGTGAVGGLLQASPKVIIVTNTTGGAAYAAFSLSATGKVFGSSSTSPATVKPFDLASATAAANLVDGSVLKFTVGTDGALQYK